MQKQGEIMEDKYASDWSRINTIATNIMELQSRIDSLEIQISNIQSELYSLPADYDEDGNDRNRYRRQALESRLAALNQLRSEAMMTMNVKRNEAQSLSSQYQSAAGQFTEKSRKTANVGSDFERLSNFRFGGSTAAEKGKVVNQRATSYADEARVLENLAQAASNAAMGIITENDTNTISDRGTFERPGNNVSANNNSETNEKIANNVDEQQSLNHSAINGIYAIADSMKDRIATEDSNTFINGGESNIGGLNSNSGISIRRKEQTIEDLSVASVQTELFGEDMVSQADEKLAEIYGISTMAFKQLRTENHLSYVKRGDNAYLVNGNLAEAEGWSIEEEPSEIALKEVKTPPDAYGDAVKNGDMKTANVKATFSNSSSVLGSVQTNKTGQLSDHEWSYNEKTTWIQSVVPGIDKSGAECIVSAMEFYSGFGYKEIHWDEHAQLAPTQNILRVFDSKCVGTYEGTIHRGISFDSKRDLKKALARGCRDSWNEPGITSFSADKSIAEDFASRKKWGLVLSCNNNKSAIPFRHMSKISWEDEVLSPGGLRNRGWTIDNKSIVVDPDKHIVYADVYEN